MAGYLAIVIAVLALDTVLLFSVMLYRGLL